MVAYADPTSGNDANAIQDEAGNDVVTLSSTVVTNNSVSQSFKDVNSLQIVGSTVNDKDWDQHAGGGHIRADLSQLNDRDTSAVITFQWYADDLAISGATASDLILEDYNISSEAIYLVATYSTLSGEQVTVTSPTLEQGDWRIFSGGEDGTISGNNPAPFMETYSFSNSSRTHNGDGWYEDRILASDTHSITSVGAAETGLSAIEGDRIIRIAATEGSKRAELGNRNWNTRVQENQDLYISEKIYLPKEEWDVVTQYSTLIFQHKQYPGADPNFELRLSNEGNYKLFVQSPYGHYGLTGAKHNDHTIATLSPDRWHDLKIHLIPSQDDSLGQVTIYLDGETVFSGTGTNLNDRDNTNDSFLKLGMYTNIEDSRHYYVDAVEMSTFLPSTVNDWVTGDRQVSNTITDTSGSDLLVDKAQVNSIKGGEQSHSEVAVLSDGKFVVTWRSESSDGDGYGIAAQLFSATGVAVGSEMQVNETVAGDQTNVQVTALSNGGFATTWTSYGQDSDRGGVYAKIYDGSASVVAQEFHVNTTSTGNQGDYWDGLSLDQLSNGNIILAWSSDQNSNSSTDVYGKIISSTGATVFDEFILNSTTVSVQEDAKVSATQDGGFIAVWQSYDPDGTYFDIQAQKFNVDGVAQGAEFTVNTETASQQLSPEITELTNSDYVVVWASAEQDTANSYGIFGQLFDANGTAKGAEFQVNTYVEGRQDSPSIAALSDGGFVVSWNSVGQDGSNYGVYAQKFTSAGAKDGSETRLAENTEMNQMFASLDATGNGNFIASWHSNHDGVEYTPYDIYADIYNGDTLVADVV